MKRRNKNSIKEIHLISIIFRFAFVRAAPQKRTSECNTSERARISRQILTQRATNTCETFQVSTRWAIVSFHPRATLVNVIFSEKSGFLLTARSWKLAGSAKTITTSAPARIDFSMSTTSSKEHQSAS